MSTVEPIAADRLDRDVSGRVLNPDTGLPYPGSSAAQEQLADELLDRLAGGLDGRELSREELRDALIEVAVRQHGRTLRDIRAELNGQAAALETDARRDLDDAHASDGGVNRGTLASAVQKAERAAALRTVVLGAWRS